MSPAPLARRSVLTAAAGAAAAGAGVTLAAPAVAAGWNPLSIAGCDVWFDASAKSDGLRSSSATPRPVGMIANLATSSAAREDVRSYQPLLERSGMHGRPALRFDGAQGLTTAITGRPHSATHVAVIEQDEIRAGSFLGTGADGAGDGFEFRVNADGTVTGARSGVWEIGTSSRRIVAGRPNLVAFLYDSSGSWACVVNGEVSGFGYGGGWAYGQTAPSTFAIGYSSPAAVGWFTGRVAEVVRWRRALRGDELRAVHQQLAAKWGVRLAAHVPATAAAPFTAPKHLKGSNISPRADMYGQDPCVWTTFWRAWDWQWVQHNIDTAHRYGARAIRIIGGVEAVLSGAISQHAYDARQRQVIAELQRRGMHYYPCGFDLHGSSTRPTARLAASLSATARVLAKHRDVVLGFDLVNELATNYRSYGRERAIALVERLASSVRRAAPHLPLTASDVGDLDWGVLSRGTPASTYRRLAAHLDFFDVHAYAGTGLRPWHLLPYELQIGRPIVLGEFGEDVQERGDDAGAAYYDRIRSLRSASTGLKAVFQWAVIEDTCGLEPQSAGTARAATIAAWRRL